MESLLTHSSPVHATPCADALCSPRARRARHPKGWLPRACVSGLMVAALGLTGCDSGGASSAAEVSFDPAGTSLSATTVQAALAGLDGALAGTNGQVSGLDTRLAALEGGSGDDLGAQVAALDTRVTALEGSGAPAAADVTVEAIAGLDGATVQAALASLQSTVATLQSTVDAQAATITTLQGTVDAQAATIAALQEGVDRVSTCPEGMVAAGSACVDTELRSSGSSTDYEGASYTCAEEGLRLCTVSELEAMCRAKPNPAALPELGDGIRERTLHMGAAPYETWVYEVALSCGITDQRVTSVAGTSGFPYRCCRDRF